MDVTWTPVDGHKAGMVAISLAALASIISVAALLSFCAWNLRRYSRLSSTERIAAETRGLKFLISDHFPLLVSLLLGDFISAVGFAMNLQWLARDSYPSDRPTGACTVQGVLIELGDMVSVLGSLLIGVHIAAMLILSHKLSRNVLYGCIAACWVVPGIFTAVGPAVATVEHPFYGWAGGWCWIGAYHPYQPYKLWLHYLWVFGVGIVNLLLYSVVFFKLVLGGKLVSGKKMGGATASAARSMLFYPFVYLATVLPLSCYRVSALAGHPWSYKFELGAGCVFTLSGLVNCLVYAITRKIIPTGGLSFLRGSSNSESEDLSTGKSRGFRFGARSATATAVGTVSAFNVGATSFGAGGPSYVQGLGISQREERMVSFQNLGGKGVDTFEMVPPKSPVDGEQVELEVWGH